MTNRQTIIDYGVELAKVIATRSPDPYKKVGAVIFDESNRVIACGYNGLAPGFIAPDNFWDDKDKRRPFMIHAEINALSYIKRGEGKILVCTLKPCPSCLKACIAHGIKNIWYLEEKPGLEESDEIARMFGISFVSIGKWNHSKK